MKMVERIQYLSALALTGTWQGSSRRSKLYDELGWETLSDRRRCHHFLKIYKIINNENPSYLKHKLIARRRCQRNLNATTFENVYCRTDRYKNSFFFPDAASSWNIFTSHLFEMPSFNLFKKHVFSLFRPK